MDDTNYYATVVLCDGSILGTYRRSLANCWDFVWQKRADYSFSSFRIWQNIDDDHVISIASYHRNAQPYWYISASYFAEAAGITVSQVYKLSRELRRLNLINDGHDGNELMISSEALEWLKWKGGKNGNLNH